MARKRIKINNASLTRHSAILPTESVIGGSVFLISGHLLKKAAGFYLPAFILAAMAAAVVFFASGDLAGKEGKSIYDGLDLYLGRTWSLLCRKYRILAFATACLAEMLAAGAVFQELVPKAPYAAFCGVTALLIVVMQGRYFDERFGKIRVFFVFIRIVLLLTFSVAMLGNRTLSLLAGSGFQSVNSLSFDGFDWLCAVPGFVILFSGIENSHGSGADEEQRVSLLYRIIVLYFLASLALFFSVPIYRSSFGTTAFLIPVEIADGKKLLLPLIRIAVMLTSLTCASSSRLVALQETEGISRKETEYIRFFPLLAIPLCLSGKTTYITLFYFSGLLFITEWMIILAGYLKKTVSEKKAYGIVLSVLSLLLLGAGAAAMFAGGGAIPVAYAVSVLFVLVSFKKIV